MAASTEISAEKVERLEDDVARLKETVFGNGKLGMDENVRNLVGDMQEVMQRLQKIADHTGPTRSELEALKKAIFNRLNLDALGNPGQYGPYDHPKRRVEDQKSKFSAVLIDIVRLVSVAVLVWLFTDVFPRIFSI